MSDSLYFLGIDPGNNLGISLLEIDPSNLNILGISTHRYILDRHIDHDEQIMLSKWFVIEDIVAHIANTYQPYVVAMEAAFLNVRYPNAIITLGSYTTILEKSLSTFLRHNRIFKYPPKYVKKTLGDGNADKEDMMINVGAIKEISDKIDTRLLSEHEVDATAIAYTALLEVRKYPYILYSL